MTTIIAMSGQKGGIGRTTIAECLAAHWLQLESSVLLVDADPQRTASTWAELALEHNLQAPTVVSMGAAMWQADQLPRLAPRFDYVIIDTPPRLGDVQAAALMIADIALVPCGPSAHDCWALAESIESLRKAQALRPDLEARIVITRKMARTIVGREARDVLAETGLSVLEAELGYRTDYQEASAAGAGVTTWRPNGEAAREIAALGAEIVKLARSTKRRVARGDKRQRAQSAGGAR